MHKRDDFSKTSSCSTNTRVSKNIKQTTYITCAIREHEVYLVFFHGDGQEPISGVLSCKASAMAHRPEDECALRVCDGGAPTAYEAVQIVRSARSSRSKALAATGLSALAIVGTILLSTGRYQSRVVGPPAARAVSEAAASLSIGIAPKVAAAPGKVAGAQALQGVPGVLTPPPPIGYNIFDPHYSQDGVGPDHPGGTENNVFTGHTVGTEGGPLTFGNRVLPNSPILCTPRECWGVPVQPLPQPCRRAKDRANERERKKKERRERVRRDGRSTRNWENNGVCPSVGGESLW